MGSQKVTDQNQILAQSLSSKSNSWEWHFLWLSDLNQQGHFLKSFFPGEPLCLWLVSAFSFHFSTLPLRLPIKFSLRARHTGQPEHLIYVNFMLHSIFVQISPSPNHIADSLIWTRNTFYRIWVLSIGDIPAVKQEEGFHPPKENRKHIHIHGGSTRQKSDQISFLISK